MDALKSLFDVAKIAASGHPLLERVMRREDWGGTYMVTPVFRDCHASDVCWLSTRVTDYEVARARSELDLALETRRMVAVLGARLSRALFVSTPTKRLGWGRTIDADCPMDDRVASLEDWVPWSAPTSADNWRGINRSVDVPRLAGQRLCVSGMPAEEAFAEADARAELEGADDAPFYMNPATYERLPKHARRSTIVQDADCPEDVVWRLPDGCLSLVSCGAAPHMLAYDGNEVLRVVRNADEDYTGELEVRIGFYGNTVLQNPGHVIQIRGLELESKTLGSRSFLGGWDDAASKAVPTKDSSYIIFGGRAIPVQAANNVTQATTIKADTELERPCPNKTCGKMNSLSEKKCWNCELVL